MTYLIKTQQPLIKDKFNLIKYAKRFGIISFIKTLIKTNSNMQ